MEKDFIQTFDTVEDMLPAVKDLIVNYCIDNEVDEKNIHPTLWNDILDEIKIHIVKPNNRLLKTDTNRYNQYDKDKVYILYNYIFSQSTNGAKKAVSPWDEIEGMGDINFALENNFKSIKIWKIVSPSKDELTKIID